MIILLIKFVVFFLFEVLINCATHIQTHIYMNAQYLDNMKSILNNGIITPNVRGEIDIVLHQDNIECVTQAHVQVRTYIHTYTHTYIYFQICMYEYIGSTELLTRHRCWSWLGSWEIEGKRKSRAECCTHFNLDGFGDNTWGHQGSSMWDISILSKHYKVLYSVTAKANFNA